MLIRIIRLNTKFFSKCCKHELIRNIRNILTTINSANSSYMQINAKDITAVYPLIEFNNHSYIWLIHAWKVLFIQVWNALFIRV